MADYDEFKLWKDMIISQCQRLGSAAVTVQDIEKALCRQETESLCIREVRKVFEEMLQTGDLKTRKDFMKLPKPHQNTFKANLLKRVKVVKKFLLQPFRPNFSEITFVVQEVVENQAEKLQKLLKNQVVSKTEVIKKAGETLKMSPDGVSLAFHVLLCQQRVAIRSDLLKFAPSGKKIQEISDTEYSIGQLELMEQKLTRIINSLDEEMKQKEKKAREYVGKNQKLAKLYLLERNSLMKKLEQQTNAQISIQAIQKMLANVNAVTVNKEILQAYMDGRKSLRDALEETRITMEMVDQIMKEMQDPYMLSNDVETALGTDLAATDTAELEKELQDIMEEEKENENLNT